MNAKLAMNDSVLNKGFVSLAVQTNNEHCTKIHFGPSAEEFVPLDKLSQQEEPFVLNFMY